MQALALEIDQLFQKLASVSVCGSSALLLAGLTYGVAELCYYWPILQFKVI